MRTTFSNSSLQAQGGLKAPLGFTPDPGGKKGVNAPLPKRVKPSATSLTFTVGVQGAKEVIVTGDFATWATDKVKRGRGGDGKWRTGIALAPGEVQYRLLVDGEWRDQSDASKRVPNPFGTENCVITVS